MFAYDIDTKGMIFNIQRFSVHDGPGIRTVVFLKGCHMNCPWCSNPESLRLEQEIMYYPANCIDCNKCLDVCPAGAIDFSVPSRVNRGKCNICGKCAGVCYANALVMAGQEKTVEEILEILKKDNIFYRNSGGGITISGGEPFVQYEFLEQLLKGCKANGWHNTIETTGHTTTKILKLILPLLDLVLMDVKHMNDEKHKEHVGVSNKNLLDNARVIAESGVSLIIRVPVIPGFNDDLMNINATAGFAVSLSNVKDLHLLPYHRLGQEKYGYLYREYQYEGLVPPARNDIEELKTIVETYGLCCSVGGG